MLSGIGIASCQRLKISTALSHNSAKFRRDKELRSRNQISRRDLTWRWRHAELENCYP
uniref:Uncharacterized protein n=1 Tax=uncultured marine microorganism HF4000_137B17 TaxID=455523 RepID=B3T288_9ZZZZ|nr:hypothetical protein ALOHA_HF4000137B17ctg1g34 [uncultured marine microorganism HF4000_137B17]